VEGSEARRAAAAVGNYSTTTNLEKRQSLHAFVTRVEGRHTSEFVTGLSAGSVIVDVGCGNGTWLRQTSTQGSDTGLDVSMAMLRSARAGGGHPVVCGDAQALPLRAKTADVVLVLWMLYHVPDKHAALMEARRVLKPGGQLIAATNENSECGAHADLIRQALSKTLGRDVDQWIEPLDFNATNGRKILSEHFGRVDEEPWAAHYELTDAEPLVSYLDSGKEPIEAELGEELPWNDVLAAARVLIDEHIDRYGALRFRRRGATFIAR
jgi:ubiquinone/menaquinone biosynthesis C-methylase UbiE